MFENKTNSEILSKLKIDESILRHKYMTGGGKGLDLLQALHEVVSPEEIIKHAKAFKMTESNLYFLKAWLEADCKMCKAVEITGRGHGYVTRAIFDNGYWGVMTKIRRYIIEWEPTMTPQGEIKFKHYDWLLKPEVFFTNEDSILIKRECNEDAYESRQDFRSRDTFYGDQVFCYKLENGLWRKGNGYEKQELLDSIGLMEVLMGQEG